MCSICENISFSNSSVDEELKKVGLYDSVMKLENKEHSNISKIFDQGGVNFSGGEKQKIAIARAIKKESKIIVLDEPTSELSIESECNLYEILKECNSTVFFISHRLSSCKFADRILVFSNGEIIESGNHDELMNNRRTYYEMFKTQSNNYVKVTDNYE